MQLYEAVPLTAGTTDLLQALSPSHEPRESQKEVSDGFLSFSRQRCHLLLLTSGLSSHVGGGGDVLINESKHCSADLPV